MYAIRSYYVWCVICHVVLVVSEVTDIMNVDGNQPTLACTQENTAFKVWGEYFGQEGEDLELHNLILA